MKYYETHFEDYLQQPNIHPKLNNYYKLFPNNLKDLKNLIFYGPSGVGKYSQVLYAIKKYSPSELKYEKKISICFNKNIYYFKISDIHYEIDMSLLGCNSKLFWNEIFQNIIDIISINKFNNSGIIVCKYFEKINTELLEIFYSYMQNIYINISIKFILITEELTFIPDNIINISNIIPISRPSKYTYQKYFNKNIENIKDITNIKCLKGNIKCINTYKSICNTIIDKIINYDKLDNIKFREILYDIFIYNINIYQCIWYILFELVKLNKIDNKNIDPIIKTTYEFFQYYNNNYRPIYHLESYFLYLILNINE